jgi:hypothetical protein
MKSLDASFLYTHKIKKWEAMKYLLLHYIKFEKKEN